MAEDDDWFGAIGAEGAGDAEERQEIVPGVSHTEIAACCRVLDALGKNMTLVTSSPDLKGLRKSLIPFVQAESAKRFGGMSKDDNDARRQAAQQSNREQQQAKARDRKFIENTLLRAGRRAKLDALIEATDDDRLLLLVPDGLGAQLLPGAPQHTPNALLGAPQEEAAHCDGPQDADARTGTCALLDGTAEAGADVLSLPTTPPPLQTPRACYTCKVRFTQLHFFYDQLCPACAQLNYKKRLQTADLSEKIAVLTGSRVKIGYRVALKLLRCGATLIATSRFPRDAAERFAQELDFSRWSHRLHVVGLDLRDLVAVEHLTSFIAQRFGRVDILINNACQTVRRPRGYYAPQVEQEEKLAHSHTGEVARVTALHCVFEKSLSASLDAQMLLQREHHSIPRTPSDEAKGLHEGEGERDTEVVAGRNAGSGRVGGEWRSGVGRSAGLSQMALTLEDTRCGEEVLPCGRVDVNGQQLDLRRENSWILKMDQVSSTAALLEVMS